MTGFVNGGHIGILAVLERRNPPPNVCILTPMDGMMLDFKSNVSNVEPI